MAFASTPSTPQVRGRGIARAALAASLIAGMGVVGVATGPAAHAIPSPSCLSFDSLTQSSSTGVMNCEVPAGVTALTAVVTGAGGGGGSGARTSTGGHGAVVTTTITVTPGDVLDLEVGTGGAALSGSSAAGGGGGGWSAIHRSITPLVIAGGGGGGGSVDGGTALSPGLVLAGGHAGTPDAAAGSPAVVSTLPGDGVNSAGGATTSAGGAGGTAASQSGGAGSAGAGGRGGEPCSGGGSFGGSTWQGGGTSAMCGVSSGGGGGSGAFGGGGGGASYGGAVAGGSGGGGSSYVASGSAGYTLATNGGANRAAGGAGRIQLTAPAPTVSSIAPAGGVVTGGTSVTVTGTNFGSGTTVDIGGHACTSVTVNSPTSLTCTAPAGSAGAADVVVTSSGQSATLHHGYTYVLGAPGAPTSVVATAGTSSITVTWAAPSTGGTVTSYEVRTAQGVAVCTTTTLSCVLGAEAGTAYDVTVVAIGPAGTGAPGQATSGVVSSPVVPTTVPSNAPLTLTTDKGQITTAEPGQDIVVIGTGFAPYSTATIVIYSTPTVLGTVVTDGSGNFSRQVTVPASLAAGVHNLLATGVDPQGAAHSMRMEVTVAAAAAPAGAGGPSLASTGFSAADPLALGGLLLAGGIGLALAGRRKAGRAGA